MRLFVRSILFIMLLAPLADVESAAALTADQVALVVNRNLPASVTLAEYYAKARSIPKGNIIELSLPVTEEISFDQYERAVVPPIRDFLRGNGLQEKIKCLVTMHGVPFRIGPHINSAREVGELATLLDERDQTRRRLEAELGGLESYAAELSPGYQPNRPATDLLSLAGRADAAFRAAQPYLNDAPDPTTHQQIFARLMSYMQELSGMGSILEQVVVPPETSAPIGEDAAAPATDARNEAIRLKEDFERARDLSAQLYDRRYDPQARAELRKLTRQTFGLFGYARLLDTQIEYFQSDYTVAALDSELSLLWWNYYPRKHWIVNPMHYVSADGASPPVLMVMRLDGPQGGNVRELIASSIKAEREGLRGRVVLDSRGIPPADANGKPDAYGVYDESIRRLGELIRTRTKLPLTIDDNPGVLPPRVARDVAVYCGWYSLRNYVPACSFAPGAVGYHIASLEMVSLRGPQEKGWVKGLLEDGMAATMGAVAEPYLHAFPPADDFFPLLMTGKLTLAEVYWRTCPLSSWMICMIGDPLYTPYKIKPALAPQDLPEKLQAILAEPETAPAAKPASTQGQAGNGR